MTAHTSRLQDTLGLSAPPIAVGFSDTPPAGLEKWQGGAVPAGCVLWREAMNGRSFYAVAADHYNCAAEIGRANSTAKQFYRNRQTQFATS
jgi:hypothetical protein